VTESRWLNAEATAKYISVRVDALSRLVRQGRIPEPNRSLGVRSPRWDRLALDATFEGGSDSTNIDELVRAGVEQILREGGTRRRKRAPDPDA
jgi:hypothetical protein